MLLYLHIPYCDSKCHYCSFNSYVDKFDTRKTYMQALDRQLAFELERFDASKNSIETVFIGGGTPSTVHPALFAPLFERLNPYLQYNAEITTEANPNSATLSWIKEMKTLGVNRISLGVQSFNADKLQALNRAHSPQQAIDAVFDAKEVGVEHISLDLIYNYRGDTESLLLSDIEQALSLPVDHLSAYELTIESGTAFTSTPEVRQENESLAFFVAEEIQKRGFTQYEISNFGKYQSRHNTGYWKQKEYIGAGAGAVGFLKNTRFYPQKNIDAYIQNPLLIKEEELSGNDLLTEKIFLGLRSSIGLKRSELPPEVIRQAERLVEENKLVEKDQRLYNPNYFLSDELALFLLSERS